MVQYLETGLDGNRSIIWAHKDPDILEIDLRAYYGGGYPRMGLRSVGRDVAETTELWGSRMFLHWLDPRSRRKVKRSFCLGSIINE